MEFKADNRTFEIIVASDVDRDGLGIELWDRDNDKMLMEIFRHDDKRKITFFSEKQEIPLEVLEKYLADFEKRVGKEFQEDNWE